MVDTLRKEAVEFAYEPALGGAVRRALDGVAADELVLLLGAQGMDRAAEHARAVLDDH